MILFPLKQSRTFGNHNEDHRQMAKNQFIFKITGSTTANISKNEYGAYHTIIPAMRCARVKYIGPHEGLENVIDCLHVQWFDANQSRPKIPPYFLSTLILFMKWMNMIYRLIFVYQFVRSCLFFEISTKVEYGLVTIY